MTFRFLYSNVSRCREEDYENHTSKSVKRFQFSSPLGPRKKKQKTKKKQKPQLTYSQEMAFVLLDLVANILIEEQLAEDEGAHGLHIQTLRLRQDLLIGPVDGSALLLLLEEKKKIYLLEFFFLYFR